MLCQRRLHFYTFQLIFWEKPFYGYPRYSSVIVGPAYGHLFGDNWCFIKNRKPFFVCLDVVTVIMTVLNKTNNSTVVSLYSGGGVNETRHYRFRWGGKINRIYCADPESCRCGA